jgi:glycosyltransferase involved in cell wall biosynthesis
MPPPLDVVPVRPRPRAEFGLPDDRFIFLFSFSPASVTARKNPFGVIEAFRRAFGRPAAGPMLVIKTHHLDSLLDATLLARDLRAAIEAVGGRLIEDNLTREQMMGLLDCCDCYVSLHRSEGFGLGMAEAMALGKPVIATGYSGNTDYMLPDNSWLVRYTLRAITPEDHRYQPELSNIYPAGQLWAEPDLDHAAELMHAVNADPARAAQVGATAAQHVRHHFSPAAAGARIVERLGAIAASTGQ